MLMAMMMILMVVTQCVSESILLGNLMIMICDDTNGSGQNWIVQVPINPLGIPGVGITD